MYALSVPSFKPGLEDRRPRVVISEAFGYISSYFMLLQINICEVEEDNTSLPQTLFKCCDMFGYYDD